MSPTIAARAAMRTATRRNFSIWSHVRAAARTFEPHPFQRLPYTETPQAANWGRMFKRVGGTFLIYVPGMGFVLGWPLLSQAIMDGHVGSNPKKLEQ